MKLKFLKSTMKFMVMAIIASTIFVSCEKDKDDPDPVVIILDGLYLKVDGATDADLVSTVKFALTRNEVLNDVTEENRSSLYEIYMTLEAGSAGFNIVQVAGSDIKSYGPAADFAMIAEADLDLEEPTMGLWKGGFEETTSMFAVPENGLYHIVLDTEVGKMAIAKVVWGVIGGATPGGWSGSTPMSATYNADKMEFSVENVTMLENEYKFRYSNGWKIILDADLDLGDGNKGVKVNCNFGGSLDDLKSGGGNIANAEYAVYTIGLTWEKGVGSSATITKTGEAEPLAAYPEAVYLVGEGTVYGWDSPGDHPDAVMHKIAGGGDNDGIFWKILYLKGTKGFKISAAGWADPNLGFADIDEFDANGTVVSDVDGNMSVADSNMYIVVIDLRNDMKKVSVKPAEVFGMGDAFGAKDWSEDDATAKFTIDIANKALVSPALTGDGAIRVYAQHDWIPAWWNSEFNVFTGVIEYRNDGGDQDAVQGTTGQVVTLMFDDNTGKIE